MLKAIATLLFVVVGLALVGSSLFGLWRTRKSEQSPNQERFLAGTAETLSLDGDYQGTVTGYSGSWQGKAFTQTDNSGLNRFLENGEIVKKFPFKTYVAKGLRDVDLDVIKLDYNQPGNPWWLRFIVDEIVLVSPNTYLGKVYIRVVPGLVFSMGYFTLEKSLSH